MLQQAETAILKRLKAVLTPFEVKLSLFPGDPDKLPSPGRKGQILVGYKKSRFNLQSMQPVCLEQIAEFELTILLKNIRTHSEAYPLLDAVRYAITGFLPLTGPSNKCYPVSENFVEASDGTWAYSTIISVAMTLIEGLTNQHDQSPDDYINRDPSEGTTPYDPLNPIQIKAGIRRTKIDNFEQNVLDREITVTEPTN